MKKLPLALAATLLFLVAPRGAAADPSAAAPDKMARIQSLEEKGDQARIHKNYDLAGIYYREALRLDRQNAKLYDKLGVAEIRQNNLKAAHKHFLQAIKYDPSNFVAFNNLGATAYLAKQYKPAIGYFKQALALDESSAVTHLNLAEAWIGLNEIDHAMTEYSRALELNADILSGSTDGVQARIYTPEQRARIDYLLAKAYAKRGNLDGALEYLRRARENNFPDLHRVYSDQEFAALWQDARLTKIVKR
jgi:tetratricopeptide (TPR) repeat protein